MKRLLEKHLDQQKPPINSNRPQQLSRGDKGNQLNRAGIQITKTDRLSGNPTIQMKRNNSQHLGFIAKNIVQNPSNSNLQSEKLNIQAIKENLIDASNQKSQPQQQFQQNPRGFQQQNKEIDFSGWRVQNSSKNLQQRANGKKQNLDLDQQYQENPTDLFQNQANFRAAPIIQQQQKPQMQAQQLGLDTVSDYLKKQQKVQQKNSVKQPTNQIDQRQQNQYQNIRENIREDFFQDFESQQDLQEYYLKQKQQFMLQQQMEQQQQQLYRKPQQMQQQNQMGIKRSNTQGRVAEVQQDPDRNTFFQKLRQAAQNINQNNNI
eukprot:403335818